MIADKLIWNQHKNGVDVVFNNGLTVGSRIEQPLLVAEHRLLLQNGCALPHELKILVGHLIEQMMSYELIADIAVLFMIGQSTGWQDQHVTMRQRNENEYIYVSGETQNHVFIENPMCSPMLTSDSCSLIELCPIQSQIIGYWQVQSSGIEIIRLPLIASNNNIYDKEHFSRAEQMLIDAALESNLDAASQLAWHMKTMSMIRLIKKFTANPANRVSNLEFAQHCRQLKSVLIAIASKHQR